MHLEPSEAVHEPGCQHAESDASDHAQAHPQAQVAFERIQSLRRHHIACNSALSRFSADGTMQ